MKKNPFDPDMTHMSSSDYKHVYEPNDDTWLFVDALESERSNLINARISLEIGSGSGYVSTFLHNMINKESHKCFFFLVDINERAALATQQTLSKNQAGAYCDCVLTAFGDAFANRLHGKVDVLLFNPPYVPSEDEEVHYFFQKLKKQAWI
jgi:release factor glutamine methyltransferase